MGCLEVHRCCLGLLQTEAFSDANLLSMIICLWNDSIQRQKRIFLLAVYLENLRWILTNFQVMICFELISTSLVTYSIAFAKQSAHHHCRKGRCATLELAYNLFLKLNNPYY